MSTLCEVNPSVNGAKKSNNFNAFEEEFKPPFVLPSIMFEKDRRPTLLSYTASLRARGYEEEEIFSLLCLANTERCDPPLYGKGIRDLQRMSAWIATKPPGTTRSNVADAVTLSAIARARAFVQTFQWKGRFAQTCRVVFQSLLNLMERTQKGVNDAHVDASCRTLAEMTGFSWKTCARALRALSGKEQRKDVPVVLFRHVPNISFLPCRERLGEEVFASEPVD